MEATRLHLQLALQETTPGTTTNQTHHREATVAVAEDEDEAVAEAVHVHGEEGADVAEGVERAAAMTSPLKAIIHGKMKPLA